MISDDGAWTAIPGYEGWYEAHPSGLIRSVERVIPVTNSRTRPYSIRCQGKVLRPTPTNGYPYVTLWMRHVGRPQALAVYIALTFHGPRPEGYYVCHRDGVRWNSAASNLYYGTPSDNVEDMRRHGTMRCGEKTPWAKLSEDDVRYIRRNPEGLSQGKLGQRFGVPQSRISKIQRRAQWKHVA